MAPEHGDAGQEAVAPGVSAAPELAPAADVQFSPSGSSSVGASALRVRAAVQFRKHVPPEEQGPLLPRALLQERHASAAKSWKIADGRSQGPQEPEGALEESGGITSVPLQVQVFGGREAGGG